MTTMVSDESRRDNQFNGRLLDTKTFPTATFILRSPIELSSVPEDGTTVTATASGDLTLRGVTNQVTFDVRAKERDAIQVVGHTDVIFAQYRSRIPTPPASPRRTTARSSSIFGSTGLVGFDLTPTPRPHVPNRGMTHADCIRPDLGDKRARLIRAACARKRRMGLRSLRSGPAQCRASDRVAFLATRASWWSCEDAAIRADVEPIRQPRASIGL